MIKYQPGLDLPPPLLVFSEGEEGVALDLDALLSSRLLIQGSSRSGKSHLTRYLIEGLAKRIPIIVLDWEGEYPSLKEIHPFVWAGDTDEGADVPLRPSTARTICRQLVGSGGSVVVDLSELEIEQRYQTAAAFLDELMHLPREDRRAYLVVIDECHELAPQGGDVPSSKAVRAIVSRGGKRGLCPVVVTQRLSRLDKSCAEMLNWIVGRTVLDVDVKRAADQLGFDRKESQDLKTLSRGRFYAFGPAIADGSVQLFRSGPVQSHHPDGARLSGLPPTPEEIAKKLEFFRTLPTDVDPDQAGRQELIEEIERLKRELADAKAGNTSDPADIRRAVAAAERPLQEEIRGYRLSRQAMLAHLHLALTAAGEISAEETHATGREEVQPELDGVGSRGAMLREPEGPSGEENPGSHPINPGGDAGPRAAVGRAGGVAEGGDINPQLPSEDPVLNLTFAKEILAALDGGVVLHRHELADAVGSTRTSSTLRATLGKLRGAGYVTYPREFHVALAEKAVDPAPDSAGDPEDLDWKGYAQLIDVGADPKAREIVSFLVANHRAGLKYTMRGDLAKAVKMDVKSPEFHHYVRVALDLGLAEEAEGPRGFPRYRPTADAIDHEPEVAPSPAPDAKKDKPTVGIVTDVRPGNDPGVRDHARSYAIAQLKRGGFSTIEGAIHSHLGSSGPSQPDFNIGYRFGQNLGRGRCAVTYKDGEQYVFKISELAQEAGLSREREGKQ